MLFCVVGTIKLCLKKGPCIVFFLYKRTCKLYRMNMLILVTSNVRRFNIISLSLAFFIELHCMTWMSYQIFDATALKNKRKENPRHVRLFCWTFFCTQPLKDYNGLKTNKIGVVFFLFMLQESVLLWPVTMTNFFFSDSKML